MMYKCVFIYIVYRYITNKYIILYSVHRGINQITFTTRKPLNKNIEIINIIHIGIQKKNNYLTVCYNIMVI